MTRLGRFIRLNASGLCLVSSLTVAKTIETKLDADGPNSGLTAYELIEQFGGPKPIEAPDLYSGNHTSVKHIFEQTDDQVGHHFVFTIHKNEDKDRDKFTRFSDRQRNEIKAYAKSNDALKGFENETLSYSWKFKLGEGMSVSKNFSHFFQLKSVDDGIGMPILTLSGKQRKNGKRLELSHAPIATSKIVASASWDDVLGKWLQVNCKVTHGNNGKLFFEVVDLSTNAQVLTFESDNIDMWRGTKPSHFVRPKWGIYRSLKSKDLLRDTEEQVRFANFSVTKFTD